MRTGSDPVQPTYEGLVKYDLARDESVHFDPGEGRSPGEPVFVRAADGNAEDEGWVLSVVHDAARGASDLVILDATSFSRSPGGHRPSPRPGAVRLPRVVGAVGLLMRRAAGADRGGDTRSAAGHGKLSPRT